MTLIFWFNCWPFAFLTPFNHPRHLRQVSTIDILMGQVTSTFGDRDTFVTIVIPYLHFQISKHVLHTTHMVYPR